MISLITLNVVLKRSQVMLAPMCLTAWPCCHFWQFSAMFFRRECSSPRVATACESRELPVQVPHPTAHLARGGAAIDQRRELAAMPWVVALT